MRLSPKTGKQDCHVIDFVDSTNRIVGIVNGPTLFGLDPEAIVDGTSHSFTRLLSILTLSLGASVQELEARADAADGESSADSFNLTGDNGPRVPDPESVSYTDYDSPFALVNQSTGASPHIVQLSRNAWVDCGEGIHVLECLGKGHIRIEPVSEGEHNRRPSFIFWLTSLFIDGKTHFRAHYSPTMNPETASALKISKFQTNRKILDADSLADAVRGCDTYVSQKVLRGPLSLAQVASLFLVWHPCSNSTPDCSALRSGDRGQHLQTKCYLWPRGGDIIASP